MNSRNNTSGQPLIDIRELTIDSLGRGSTPRLIENISFTVYPGDIVGIVGESGAGKSLLCKALVGLKRDNIRLRGVIILQEQDGQVNNIVPMTDQDLEKLRGKTIGIQFQEPASSMNPVLQCGRQIRDALPDVERKDKAFLSERVVELLQLAGLEEAGRVARAYPHELSGGMLQRVTLACALAGRPRVLIIDEPTAALDPITTYGLMNTLDRLNRELNLALIIVSHDLNLIKTWTRQLIVMYSGQILEQGATAEVLVQPYHPYTKALLECEQALEHNEELKPIPGQIPSLLVKLAGCRFRDRCSAYQVRCSEEEPDLTSAPGGRSWRCFYPVSNTE
ncbi:MAG: ABC transporter ATP-binding protein [Candidatus Marinimicrobia bacterium]|nr:ABC transporter ATP-binding protein [Candidatus Neomarinimicrobiota bacterium]